MKMVSNNAKQINKLCYSRKIFLTRQTLWMGNPIKQKYNILPMNKAEN